MNASHIPQRIPVEIDPSYLDPEAVKVARRLTQHGYETYLVGGCVRDLLLGEHPKDFDLATNARPNEIRKIFRNCRIIGRRFRLAHILFAHNKVIEVATFRAAGNLPEPPLAPESGEDREAARVEKEPAEKENLLITDDNVFGNAESDALRRDFTLNSLFYDLQTGSVIDYAGGMEHIEKRLLVMIGDPWVRLREDPVRIIRAAKFAARLQLNIEDRLAQAMRDCHAEIIKSSSARIVEEIYKILPLKGAAQTFATLFEIGVLKYILPFLADDVEKFTGGKSAYWDYLRALEQGIFNTAPEGVLPAPSALAKPTRAIMFSALIAQLLQEEISTLNRDRILHEARLKILERIKTLGVSMRNARKDTYRAQQIFQGLERLFQGAMPAWINQQDRKRKRFIPPKKFVMRANFSESLQLFWMHALVKGEASFWKNYETWAPWQHYMPGEVHLPPRLRHGKEPFREGQEPSGEAGHFRKRRRRRRWKEHLKTT